MNRLKAGLLPLYIELYDNVLPRMRDPLESFYHAVAAAMNKRGLEITTADVCRVRQEFQAAIQSFEKAGVDAIVTLHLAYSPSLESVDALVNSRLPVIVLDTTPDLEFGPETDPDRLLYNHGIHGVQDLCNVLLRAGKRFQIEAGHWEKSDVLERVAAGVRSARLAATMASSRVGRIGGPFAGMGDFAVSPAELLSGAGIQTVPVEASQLKLLLDEVNDSSVEAEMARDKEQFLVAGLDPALHRCSARAGLALRRWSEREHLTAFTMNFMDIDRGDGLPTVPFLEAGKAMSRGLGYAGEGDVLTAAFVGALISAYPDTTFTEMFCPDWAGGSIFLSHMGEVNPRTISGTLRLTECGFPFRNVATPIIAVGRLHPGQALLLNLAPRAGGGFNLVMAPVTVLDVEGEDRWTRAIRGWVRPELPVADFLARYSLAGGTHHLALSYGASMREMSGWARIMGWETTRLAGS